jgi:hypothetical protein
MVRRGALTLLAATALCPTAFAPSAAGAATVTGPVGGAEHAAMVQQARVQGYLPTIPNFAAVKQQADAGVAAPEATIDAPAGPLTPTASPSFQGQRETDLSPSDSTGAIGPNSFIEMINVRIAIYNRSGGLIASAPAEALTGTAHFDLSDPQVMWDPATNRFYYVMLNVTNDTIQFGFSKSNNPTHIPGDFCNYDADFGYGANLPDFPKLGDTRHSLLIGVNVFRNGLTFIGSDVDFITKPTATGTITTCPARSTFLTGKRTGLKAGTALVATPNPAQQTDASTTGWVVATPNAATGSTLDLFKVTENANGTPNIPGTATSTVSVASFSSPPSAPQSGASFPIDTLDGRTLHAVTANDPAHASATALWTAHAVRGGAGSEVRWYEVNVAASNLFQSGKATSSSLFAYNGTISPDRAVNGASAHFGSNMVLNFTTSSKSAFAADQMVSKVGANAQSGFVLVHQSPGNDQGFDCVQLNLCRWGDYSGATPDPAAGPTGVSGRVWSAQMFSTGGGHLDRRGRVGDVDLGGHSLTHERARPQRRARAIQPTI